MKLPGATVAIVLAVAGAGCASGPKPVPAVGGPTPPSTSTPTLRPDSPVATPEPTGPSAATVGEREAASNGDAGALLSAGELPLAASPESVGMRSRALDSLDNYIDESLADGVSPGAALAIGRHGRLVRLRGYGRLDWAEPRPAVTDSTLYDLASLTKVVGTTTAAMILVDEGRLDLDAPVASYFPDWQGQGEKAVITVRHLLTHSAGLPAWLPLYKELSGKEAYYHRIGSLGLEYSPGTKTVYSDLGMIVLQAVIEHITGEPINRFLRERVFGPLGMTDTRFSPLQVVWGGGVGGLGAAGAEPATRDDGVSAVVDLVELLRRTAPTERDSTGLIHGYVQDENARAMGGVAGHAGLFSSARDLAVFAQMLLNGGEYDGRRIVGEQTVHLFTERQTLHSSRALGWDLASPGSSAGRYFSDRAFGHTGFTGTSIWIDPARDLFVVLLTNRVDPTRANQKHIPFRRAVHDQVARSLIDNPVVSESSHK